MKISADGNSWDIDSNGAKNNYQIHDDFTQAVFCGEFYNSGWNFGDLVFEDVQIVVQGSDASFCVSGGQSQTGGAIGTFGDVCEYFTWRRPLVFQTADSPSLALVFSLCFRWQRKHGLQHFLS